MTDATRITDFINNLVECYHYKPLPNEVASKAISLYSKYLPTHFKDNNHPLKLSTSSGQIITTDYTRVVIGHYGAYVEWSRDQALFDTYMVCPGEEYRINDPKYADHCKYEYWIPKYGVPIKIYLQKRPVKYADYKPGYFYTSVYNLFSY